MLTYNIKALEAMFECGCGKSDFFAQVYQTGKKKLSYQPPKKNHQVIKALIENFSKRNARRDSQLIMDQL